jgi:hypothetical protein
VATSSSVQPTQANIERAALHFAPEALDSETWLRRRRAVNNLYPEESREMQKDELTWNQRKGEFRQRILAEIQSPPLMFEISPWGRPPSLGVELPGDDEGMDVWISAYKPRT